MSRVRAARWLPVTAVVLLSALALGPVLLDRGYVLVGDMVFVPDQPWKPAWLGLDGSVPRAVPADAVVAVLGQVLPGDVVQKVVLLGTLVLAGTGMLRLTRLVVPGASLPARLGAGVLFVWNPYVFERLAIGHWGLLVGYAALPWVAAAAVGVRSGAPGALARLVLVLAVAAFGSPTGGLLAGLVALGVGAGRDRARTLGIVGAALVVNLPWLVPGLLNDAVASDSSGVAAFAATSDTPLGTAVSLLTFGGIWKAAAAPDERDAALLVVAALVLVLLSLLALARTTRALGVASALGPTRLAVLAATGLVLAGLPATGPGEDLVAWLVDTVPGAGLWRDSQKLLAPFVLVACLGFAVLLDRLARPLRRNGLAGVVVLVALLPVVLLPSLAWGLSGRLEPVRYPAAWQTVRTVLEGEPAESRRTVVLPWSAYQRLPWNDRRAALDPAGRFFPGDVVVDDALAVSSSRTVGGEDPAAARIGAAIARGEALGPVLDAEHVRYVLLEKSAAGAADVDLPEGVVLHDGDELLLLDLGGPGETGAARAPASRRAAVLLADAVTALVLLGAAGILIRRKAGAPIRYDMSGSSTNGGDADNR